MRRQMIVCLLVGLWLALVGVTCVMAQDTANTPTPKPTKEEVKKIDINSATSEELQTLPKIGPKMAQVIINNRPYEKIEDLMKVKGIKDKVFAKIKDLIEAKPVEQPEPTPTPTLTPTPQS
jgi:competence ComEA-like helix-hairpin-helix protein